MGLYTHWYGAVSGGAVGDQGVYRLPPKHGHTVYCNSHYHGLVSRREAEYGTDPIQALVGSSDPGYPVDKDGVCSSRGGRGRGIGERGQVW